MQAVIKIVSLSDLEQLHNLVVEIINEMKIYYKAEMIADELEKYSLKKLKAFVSDIDLTESKVSNSDKTSANRFVLGAYLASQIVGFQIVSIEAGIATLEWSGVKKEFREQGIGRRIKESVEKELQTNHKSVHKIVCDSRTNNIPSVINLLKSGYKITALLKDHWYHEEYYLYEKYI